MKTLSLLRRRPVLSSVLFFAAATAVHAATLPPAVTTASLQNGQELRAVVDPFGNLIVSSQAIVTSISSAGAALWSINSPSSSGGLTVDAQGNSYLTGGLWEVSGVPGPHDLAVTKISPAGAVLWTRQTGLPGAYDSGTKIVVDDQGGIYAAGYSTGTSMDIFLAKYDSAGVFQWSRRFNGSADLEDNTAGLVAMPGGGVVITGLTRNPDEQFITIRYAATGSPQWVAFYDAPGVTEGAPCGVVRTSDGGLAIAGMSGLKTVATVKYSAAGAELWANRSNLETTSATEAGIVTSIVAAAGGGAAVLGAIDTGDPPNDTTDLSVIVTSGSGTTVWQKPARTAMTGPPDSIPSTMAVLPGGGYVVAAGSNPYSSSPVTIARLTCLDAATGDAADAFTWPKPNPFGGNLSCQALATGADGSVWAVASSGISSAIIKRFGSAPVTGAPTVTGLDIDNLQPASARFRSQVNPHGSVTTYNYIYGTTASTVLSTPPRTLPAGTNAIDAFEPGVPLSPGTTYLLRVQASNEFGSYLSAARLFTTPPSPYQTWTVNAFGSPNAPGSARLDDPDKDGADNLTEYTFGGNPSTPGTLSGLPVFTWWESPDSGLTFPGITYKPDPLHTDVTITPVASSDLVNWTTTGVLVTNLPDGTRRAVFQSNARYMRLQITSP